MEEHTAALAAFHRVTGLAREHHCALDQAARLMHAHAWVGGGAPRFAAALEQRRRSLQVVFSQALELVAKTVARLGGQVPAIPALSTSAAVLTSRPGRFQGIDPTAMAALINNLQHAAETLPTAGSRLSAELSALGLPTASGPIVGQVGDWSARHATQLRVRLAQIRADVPWTAALAAFSLFGSHNNDPLNVAEGLKRIAAGNSTALGDLLAVQERGQQPDLSARIQAWWQTLSAAQQEQLISLAGFGLLNGLPSSVRDRANRHWLTEEKARLTRELDAQTTELVGQGAPGLLGAWEKTSRQLKRIELVERALAPVPGHPPPLLLGFSLTGLGRLIISWGNPDTAHITVTSVSGLTSGLDVALGDLERSRALWQQASATAGNRKVASITWLGYDAPQLDPGLLDPGKSVAFDHAASKGGAALAAFTDGLRAAHLPDGGAHSVVLGHSYGSLTTGKAAVLRPGQLADDLIFVGSPGVGVEHARDLGISPEHVWVGEAGNDPVACLGRFGADPGHTNFGARSFLVGRTVVNEAHSSYWNPQSVSLRNLGRIITGHHQQLETPEPLSQTPQLLMPELAPDLVLRSEG